MKGYKGFDKNLRCRGFRFKVGQEYQIEGKIEVCKNGFHFCQRLADINDFYDLKESRICEIEALGDVKAEGSKSVTDRIKIIRELSHTEVLSLANVGKENTGIRNSGNQNSGDQNSGDQNSGNWNSGDRNSGNLNSGNWNSGNQNSGNRNSGDRNSGDRNSGNLNSGDLNSGNLNSGDFCSCNNSAGLFMSKRLSYEAFNKPLTEGEYESIIVSEGFMICKRFSLVRYRVRTKTGKLGDYRHLPYKASWKVFWNSLTFAQRCAVRKMPHFDKAVFEEITGIKL